MKMKELQNKSKDELQKELKKLNEDLQKNTTEVLKRKEKNVHRPREIRKDIARVKTALAQINQQEENA